MRETGAPEGPLGIQPVRSMLSLSALCEASGLSPGVVSRALRGWHRSSPALVQAAVKLTGQPKTKLFTPAFLEPKRSALPKSEGV
ncbi:MAG: hypothetical protein M3N25_01835 [Actinomycetota bacterium]|nr:hypothetical protein [Actinomycetota bacterium]